MESDTNWRRVEQTTQWPYSPYGVVTFRIKNISYWGTGILIAPNVVLTAGLHIYDQSKRIYSDLETMQFFPGVNGTLLPFGVVRIKKYFISRKDVQSDESESFGILILDECIGHKTGYFKLACVDRDQVREKKLYTMGYVANTAKPVAFDLWEMTEIPLDIEKSEIYPGQAGSGIWYQEGVDYYVCGVRLVTREKTVNQLLTLPTKKEIEGWINENINMNVKVDVGVGVGMDGDQSIKKKTKIVKWFIKIQSILKKVCLS